MLRTTPLVEGETYHIYNRGANKRDVFRSESDSLFFLALLHLSNSSQSVRLEGYKTQGRSLRDVFEAAGPDKSLVDVSAYSLMPNHFHLVLKQKGDDGITRFMKKVCTAYSMYFNTKYERSGVLFQGRFRSSHVDSEPYFRWIFSYIHLNPVSLVEPAWKENGIKETAKVRSFLRNYAYSSFFDYSVGKRPERAILAYDDAPDFLTTQDDLEELLTGFERGRVLHDDL